jgi:two-component system OmpR family response regulator
MKLLLVEDDREAGAYLKRAFGQAGHTVDHAEAGREGLLLAAAETYDVIVLDRMLPEVDGMTILRTMRASNIQTPVLLLTAMDGIDDRVEGLEAGADDYLVKPFAFAELLARLNALARRPPTQELAMSLRVADLEVDLLRRTVTRSGARIDLQPREYQILEFLLRHAGRVVTRTMLLESVWDFHFDPKTNIVETHMSRLRAKLCRDDAPDLIHTVRGAGYCLREP